MKLTALKSFRPGNRKGEMVARGEAFEIDDSTGHQLVALGIAAAGAKALKEYENKMEATPKNKGMPLESETSEERSQGYSGPTAKSDTPEVRSQGVGVPVKKQPKPVSQIPGREIVS